MLEIFKKMIKSNDYLFCFFKSLRAIKELAIRVLGFASFRTSPNCLIFSKYGAVIVNKFDLYIGKSLIKGVYWDEKTIDVIEILLKIKLQEKDKVIFYDAGANIGTHSLAISKKLGDQVKIRSFEAQKLVFYMLCGTVALNNIKNIICHYNALSNVSGEKIKIKLPNYTKPNNFGSFELIPPVKSDNHHMSLSEDFELVDTIKLDDFEEIVDLIKLDVEGMESIVLAGAENLINKSRPFCIVELIKTDADKVLKFFNNLNYVKVDQDGDGLFIPNEYIEKVNL